MHLQPTPPEKLCDPDGRPYFLWDVDLTLADYLRRLDDPDEVVRAYWIGVALRQAKPDDAIALLGPDRIVAAMPLLSGRLGKSAGFWDWLTAQWNREGA
ncbi:MAG: hypothetical protein IV100_10750 [Myxococcales bacterium]|nr:hypothetical protein [Myxococcales bacterium]MBT9556501.1 hypothetical protein [Myxococcales bacterium]